MLKRILKLSSFDYLVVLLIGFLSNFLYAGQSSISEYTEPSKNYSKIISSNEKQEDLSLEVKQLILEARKRAGQYFNFKTGHFKPNITKQEKQQFYNDLLDSLVISDKEFYRFDRTEQQEFITDEQRKQQELVIQEIADRCVKYIGEEPKDKDNKMLVMKQGTLLSTVSLSLPNTKDSKEIINKIQNNYLQGRVQKCVTFIYGDSYSLKDFEYYDYAQPKTDKQRKQYWVDGGLYPELYFEIKEAGLLRTIPSAYYPKSLVREHSDLSGLTKYIHKQQKRKNQQLNHQQLAIEFFGSNESWIILLNEYINKRLDFYRHSSIRRDCPPDKVANSDPVGNLTIFGLKHLDGYQGYFCERKIPSNNYVNFKDKLYARMLQVYDVDKKIFYPHVSNEEKAQFAINYDDFLVRTEEQLFRFDRSEKQPVPTEQQKKQYRIKILKLSNQCLSVFNLQVEQPNYETTLESAVKKCVKKIYGGKQGKKIEPKYCEHILKNIKNNLPVNDNEALKCKYAMISDREYSLTSFEYDTDVNKTKDGRKLKQAEQIYEQTYLVIKKAGFLREISSAFYPKSLIRKHANLTGLTKYIQEQEQQANKKLNHDELAVKYFGGYSNWIKSLNIFINSKL